MCNNRFVRKVSTRVNAAKREVSGTVSRLLKQTGKLSIVKIRGDHCVAPAENLTEGLGFPLTSGQRSVDDSGLIVHYHF